MKILFITSSRLGDAVLSTGILDELLRRHPAAEVTVACGPLAASLFEGLPNLKAIIPIRKQSFARHWFRLWTRVVGTRWDMVVDLRNSLVSRLVVTRLRFTRPPAADRTLHKVEQNAAVARLSPSPAPALWPSAAQAGRAADLIPPGQPVLAVGPAANWIGKTWPADRFIDLVARLTGPAGILPGARVAVIAAPGEEAIAGQVLAAIPPDRRIDLIARVDPGTAAAAIRRCALYIGNDSGLMHAAAAAGIPTVGLFGPSWPHLYRPWGPHATFIATAQTYDELLATVPPGAPDRSLMDTLSVDAVAAHVEAFWRGLHPAPSRDSPPPA